MSRVAATMSIWSEILTPDKVSRLLNFQPDNSVLKGSDRTPPRPRPLAHGWHITHEDMALLDAGIVFDRLMERAAPFIANFGDLHEQDHSLKTVVSIHVTAKKSAWGAIPIHFSAASLRKLAIIQGELDVEYFEEYQL